MSSHERRYGAGELREILRRAQRQDAKPDEGLTRAELLEIGRDVGVDEEQMSTALTRYDGDLQLAAAETELRQIARRGFATHLIAFVWVGAVLGLISVWAGPPVLIPLLLWGMALTLHLRSAFFPHPDKLREQARKRLVRQRLKASSQHFGEALADGAARVLSAAAERLDGATGKSDSRARTATEARGRDGTKRSL